MSEGAYRSKARILKEYLADRDVACPGPCGVNLRGVDGTVCPKCGRDLWVILDMGPMPIPSTVAEYLAVEHPACPQCGYDLHGSTSARCQECGRIMSLEDFFPEPGPVNSGALTFISAVLGLVAGAFFAGISSFFGVARPHTSGSTLVVLSVIILAVCVAGCSLMFFRKKGFDKRPTSEQQPIAMLCWALPIFQVASCIALIP